MTRSERRQQAVNGGRSRLSRSITRDPLVRLGISANLDVVTKRELFAPGERTPESMFIQHVGWLPYL